MKSIIHGIGKAVLRDFKDRTKIMAMTDMQDLSLESTFSADDITGGNKLFPIASFKKDQALNGSVTNATFSSGLLPYMDGATKGAAKAAVFTDVKEIIIPEDGKVQLDVTPTNVYVEGFEKTESTVAAGKFKVETKAVTFDASDKGKSIELVYDYASSEKTVEYSVTQGSMSKPFEFNYIFPIYDEDTQVTHKGFIVIYKAQCTSGFSINPQHQTAFAPKFEFSARDAKRPDGKFWSLFIDDVEVGN